jgi:hypothetical protein
MLYTTDLSDGITRRGAQAHTDARSGTAAGNPRRGSMQRGLIRYLATLLLVLLGSALGNAVHAQDTGSSATMPVTGNLIHGISVETLQELYFDDIAGGEIKTVNFDNTATGSVVSGGERAGIIRIQTLGSFTLNFSRVPGFMEGENGDLMPVTFVSAWSPVPEPTGAVNPVSVTGSTAVTLSGNAEIYVFLGASVSPTPNQPEGFYTAEITLTATFGVD